MPSCPIGHDSTSTDFCDICGREIGGAAPAAVATPPQPVEPDVSEERCPECGEPRTGRFCEVDSYDFVAAASRTPVVTAPAPEPAPAPVSFDPVTGAVSVDPETGAVSFDPVTGAAVTGAVSAPVSMPAPMPVSAPVSLPVPPAARAWTAVVTADRAYFDSVQQQDGPDLPSITFPAYCPDRQFTLSGEHVRIGRMSRSRGLIPEIDLTGPPQDPGVSHLHAVLLAQPDGGWAVVDPGSTNGTTLNDELEPIANDVAVPVKNGDRIHVGAWTTITVHGPAA